MGMQRIIKVLDSNYINDPSLLMWLSKRNNFAVLTDHWAVEAAKHPNGKGLKLSLDPLRPYVHKLIILKLTRINITMHGKAKGLARRFINDEGTREFPHDVEDLFMPNNIRAERHLAKLHKDANHLINGAMQARTTAQGIVNDLKQDYSGEERSHLRSDVPYPDALFDKVVHQIVKLTHLSMTRYAKTPASSMRGEIYNAYLFRYMLSQFLNTLKVIGNNGQLPADIGKIVNDDFDMTYVAYATYFDGLLSNDKNANLIYSRAIPYLDRLRRLAQG
jgi:hypothetical protein